MIQRVYERVSQCTDVSRVVVATDDERIMATVHAFGGKAIMTRSDHTSGTDRIAEAATHYPQAEIIVNVQGDEPFIDPRQIAEVIKPLKNTSADIATLAHRITDERALLSPNVVKVVRDAKGRALYFSRHAIPFLRDKPIGQWVLEGKHLQHLGLYAYRAPLLPALTSMPPADLENQESLEQLRWLANGHAIHVGITDIPAIGIDTPEDLRRALHRITNP